MLRRISFLAALVTAAVFATNAQAQSSASFFASNNQSTNGNAFTYTRTAAGVNAPLPSLIRIADPINRAVAVNVDFAVNDPTFLISPGPSLYTNAKLLLTASSDTAATSTVIGGGLSLASQAGFNGSFTLLSSGGDNLLSGTFTNGTLSQFSNATDGASLSFGSADFTSSIFKPLFDASFSVSLSGPIGPLTPVGTAFKNFSAGTSATYSASIAVPEPATLAMAGLGVVGLPIALRVIRRRRSGSAS